MSPSIIPTSVSTGKGLIAPAPVADARDVKAVRAFERARQTALHPADKAKPKRNMTCSCCRPRKFRGKSGRAGNDLWKDYDMAAADLDVFDDAYAPVPRSRYIPAIAADEANRVEVLLADLVRPAKRRGIAKDFEFVDALPRVLVVDDNDEGDSSNSDDSDQLSDWECVERPVVRSKSVRFAKDSAGTPVVLSYAEVVLHAKKV